MEEPSKSNAADHTNWVYGVEKRAAEDVLARAWEKHKFPFSSLRLPIVNSERDHYDRLYGYFLRLRDGGPVLVPDAPSSPLRHVYGDDVVQAIMKLAAGSSARGRAFNIGQDETLSLEQFLQLLAELMDCKLKVMRIARQRLEHEGLLPDCSPFSGCWMSSLDNSRSKRELAMIYTSVRSYLEKLVKHFQSAPLRRIEGYSRRAEELKLARSS
jgi:nucleoside-diphosphate-sugar epimerase